MHAIFSSALLVASFLFVSSTSAQNDNLKIYGLNKGMVYVKAKSILTKSGWKPVLDEEAGKISRQFPEISCGTGKDAVCSAGFKKDKENVAFLLKSVSKSEFVVDGTY